MRRKTINGNLFNKMMQNGSISLRNNSHVIDALNVFPVPDGDTGVNMSLTIKTGVEEIKNYNSGSLGDVSKKLARGLLMGARGNSGVILSQIFRGIADGFKGLEKAGAMELAKAFESGVKASYKAVIEPVEGTILTVSREATEELLKNVNKEMYIDEVFDIYIEAAEKSLENTPNLLAVLKEAGVVDSGGAGYLDVLYGMRKTLKGEVLELDENTKNVENSSISMGGEEFDINFPFCTEFIVGLSKKNINIDEIKIAKKLEKIGDSIVCVKDYDLLKVHVHSKKPGDALNLGQQYGELLTMKIENMAAQVQQITDKKKKKDSQMKFKKTKTTEKQKYGIIAVVSGDGLEKEFYKLGCNLVIAGGQTMNPPTEDFVRAIKEVNAENVIIIPNNSNVRLSAQQSAKLVRKTKVEVLPAKTIAQGYSSLIMFDQTATLEENIENMKDAIASVSTAEVTYAVRDTEMNGIKICEGDFLGILNGSIVVSTVEMLETTKKVIDKILLTDKELITIFTGISAKKKEIKEIINYVEGNYSDIELEVIDGKQEVYTFIIGAE